MTNDNQEKITFNINVMDLAKIDYLVSNGFYSNRSDFLRTALRNQLNQHQVIISDMAIQKKLDEKVDEEKTKESINYTKCLGILLLSEDKLLKLKRENMKMNLLVFGALLIDRDIDVDLFRQTVQKIKVYGSTKGSTEILKLIKSEY